MGWSAWRCICRTSTTSIALQWTEGTTYGDVYLQNEKEQSAYNFEHSDVDFLLTAFAAHEKQASTSDRPGAGTACL